MNRPNATAPASLKPIKLSELEKQLINKYQGGFPICDHPYQAVANDLGIDETHLIDLIDSLLKRNIITRFGPLFDIQKAGGHFSLCAIAAPADMINETAEIVNNLPEVAHNYLRWNQNRSNQFNIWFVLATESEAEIPAILSNIETLTGFPVLNLPKEKEFFVGLHWEV